MEELNMVSTCEDLPSVSATIFKKISPVEADRIDRLFAAITLLLGFGFVYVFTSGDRMEWNLHLFTLAYVCFVMGYFYLKKKRISLESFFWLGIILCLGIRFSFSGIIFPVVQVFALLCVAAYWVVCMGGNLIHKNKSSQWVLVDGVNTMLFIPFTNFLCHIRVLISSDEEEKQSKIKSFRSILIGIGITIPLLFLILPLLGSADLQFALLFAHIEGFFQESILEFLLRLVLSIPVTAYLFGLIYGSLHKRNTSRYQEAQLEEDLTAIRVIPNLALHTVMGILCLVYVLFIVLQGNYLFSAFAGIRPEEYSYAEYARQGFFELCKVSVLNLVVLIGADSLGRHTRKADKVLRIMNVLLSVLTLFLIATAMSKMILYISAYGLTEKRILTMVFMVWLLVVFIVCICWQFRACAFVRISFVVGVCLYTALCILPVMEWIEMFNKAFGY